MGRAPQSPGFFDTEADNYEPLLSESAEADNDAELLLSENANVDCNADIIFTAEVKAEADIRHTTTPYPYLSNLSF